jgi:hypothetical protein
MKGKYFEIFHNTISFLLFFTRAHTPKANEGKFFASTQRKSIEEISMATIEGGVFVERRES